MPFADVAIDFPCRFPIKVVGENQTTFRDVVLRIFQRHDSELTLADLRERSSHHGRYLSITATFTAVSKDQINAIYSDLSAEPQVLWAL